MKATTLVLVAVGGLGACGGGTGTLMGTYASKCAAACEAPASGPCKGKDPVECQRACVATTEGLAAACAQCLVERTGWKGGQCLSNGCGPCDFGPDPSNCYAPPPCACTAAKESCDGFVIGEITSNDCKALCAK
jgi:hypothetical protein